MSHFTTQDIARALQVVLTTDSDVQAVLGEEPRLYDHLPDTPIFPYLTYGPMRSQDISGDEAELQTHILTLHVWSRYGGRAEVITITRAISKAVSERDFDLGDIHLVRKHILYSDIMRAPDGRTLHGLIRLSFTTDSTDQNIDQEEAA